MKSFSFELLHVGSGQFLDSKCIVAVASPTSFSIKRAVKRASAKAELIDMTHGRKTRSVIFVDDGRIFLISRAPDIIAGRLQAGGVTELENKGTTRRSRSADANIKRARVKEGLKV